MAFLFILTTAAGAGCSSSGTGSSGASSSSGGSSGSSGGQSLNGQARNELAACTNGVNDNAFDDAIEITTDFRDSCHELVVCGGLGVRLSGTVLELFLRTALGTADKDGLVFDGKVSYVTKSETVLGTTMDVTLVAPKDLSFAKAGEPIPYDLTAVSSYFVGASIKVAGELSLDGIKVKVQYQSLGPAFELLGLSGDPGPSEVTLDTKAMRQALGAIKLRAKTHVDDKKGHASFVYEMTTPETTLGAVFDGGPLGFTLDGVTGKRVELSQTLERKTWNISYVGGQVGALDGTIGFSVKGGPMPYDATFTYPKSNEPQVRFACP